MDPQARTGGMDRVKLLLTDVAFTLDRQIYPMSYSGSALRYRYRVGRDIRSILQMSSMELFLSE